MKHTHSIRTHLYLLVFAFLITFLVASQAQAHGSETTQTDHHEMTPGQIRDTRSENIDERESMRETRTAALTTQRQERIINLASNITARLDVATTRLANITARLYTRIEKLKASGVHTTLAETKLNEAKDMINATGVELASIGSIQDIVSSESSRETFAKVRTQFINVRTSLMQAHTLLRETVALLKEATQEAENERGVSSAVHNENASPEDSISVQ